jgi:hypothetical protein
MQPTGRNRLICGDVLDVLPKLGPFTCLIADPPDNIGLKYDCYHDRLPEESYQIFLHTFLSRAVLVADITWLSFNAKYLPFVGKLVHDYFERDDYECRLFMQTFTFGQNRNTDCGNGYRPLLRISFASKFYPDAIKVPSWRQKNGDKRAAPGGRVPLDVWDFPRITGNCKERRAWHPTQLREAMIDRIVKFSTLPGESVCDCFSGTGTVLRAVKDRPVTSIEIDPVYCDRISAEHNLPVEYLP